MECHISDYDRNELDDASSNADSLNSASDASSNADSLNSSSEPSLGLDDWKIDFLDSDFEYDDNDDDDDDDIIPDKDQSYFVNERIVDAYNPSHDVLKDSYLDERVGASNSDPEPAESFSSSSILYGSLLTSFCNTPISDNVLQACPWNYQHSLEHPSVSGETINSDIICCELDVVRQTIEMCYSHSNDIYVISETKHLCVSGNSRPSITLRPWVLGVTDMNNLGQYSTGIAFSHLSHSSVVRLLQWFISFGTNVLILRNFCNDCHDISTFKRPPSTTPESHPSLIVKIQVAVLDLLSSIDDMLVSWESQLVGGSHSVAYGGYDDSFTLIPSLLSLYRSCCRYESCLSAVVAVINTCKHYTDNRPTSVNGAGNDFAFEECFINECTHINRDINLLQLHSNYGDKRNGESACASNHPLSFKHSLSVMPCSQFSSFMKSLLVPLLTQSLSSFIQPHANTTDTVDTVAAWCKHTAGFMASSMLDIAIRIQATANESVAMGIGLSSNGMFPSPDLSYMCKLEGKERENATDLNLLTRSGIQRFHTLSKGEYKEDRTSLFSHHAGNCKTFQVENKSVGLFGGNHGHLEEVAMLSGGDMERLCGSSASVLGSAILQLKERDTSLDSTHQRHHADKEHMNGLFGNRRCENSDNECDERVCGRGSDGESDALALLYSQLPLSLAFELCVLTPLTNSLIDTQTLVRQELLWSPPIESVECNTAAVAQKVSTTRLPYGGAPMRPLSLPHSHYYLDYHLKFHSCLFLLVDRTWIEPFRLRLDQDRNRSTGNQGTNKGGIVYSGSGGWSASEWNQVTSMMHDNISQMCATSTSKVLFMFPHPPLMKSGLLLSNVSTCLSDLDYSHSSSSAQDKHNQNNFSHFAQRSSKMLQVELFYSWPLSEIFTADVLQMENSIMRFLLSMIEHTWTVEFCWRLLMDDISGEGTSHARVSSKENRFTEANVSRTSIKTPPPPPSPTKRAPTSEAYTLRRMCMVGCHLYVRFLIDFYTVLMNTLFEYHWNAAVLNMRQTTGAHMPGGGMQTVCMLWRSCVECMHAYIEWVGPILGRYFHLAEDVMHEIIRDAAGGSGQIGDNRGKSNAEQYSRIVQQFKGLFDEMAYITHDLSQPFSPVSILSSREKKQFVEKVHPIMMRMHA